MSKRLDDIYNRGIEALNRLYNEKEEKEPKVITEQYIEPVKYRPPKRRKEK